MTALPDPAHGLVRLPLALTMAVIVALALVSSGCTSSTQPPAPECSARGAPREVGESWPDDPPGRFTVTAGTYELAGTRFAPPAPVPLLPTDMTQAILGPGNTTPTYDSQRGTVAHQSMSVKVTKDTPAVFHLDAGSYWLVNTYGAELRLAPCDGGTITNVTLPEAHPRSSNATTATGAAQATAAAR